MNRVYVARHGQSTWNKDGRWAGQADPPLTDVGRLQAKETCVSLGQYQFTCVASSCLQRARETAAIMAHEMEISLLEPLTDLNERHYGEISGLTAQEIEERYPELMKQWRIGNPVEIPGGESWHQFVDRVFRGLRHLSTLQGCILVIAHIGVLRAIEHTVGETMTRHRNLDGMWIDLKL